MKIDWMNPESRISKYFTVHEATYLPSWGTYHIPSKKEKVNILNMAKKADKVREFIGIPMNIHCWIRPTKVTPLSDFRVNIDSLSNEQLSALKTLNYNLFVGSKSICSGHIFGLAIDFSFRGYKTSEKCHEIRQKLIPKLREFNIRMEDIEGSWIHIDSMLVKNKRFFRP